MLLKLEPGDEVIMPSFTFVSTANPFVLRGRPAGLRGLPGGHPEPGRDPGRGRPNRPDQGHRAGPLRRGGLRDGDPNRHRRKTTESPWWRTTPTASWPPTRAGPWAPSGSWPPSPFTRPRTSPAARAEPLVVNDPEAVRAGRDNPGEGDQPLPVLPGAGGQVRLDRDRLQLPCPRKSWPPFCWPSWRPGRRSRPKGANGSGSITAKT